MAQQYRPGDWYEMSSGNVMVYDGSSWKNVGQRLAPGGQAATKNGKQTSPPGAAINPVVAEEAAAVASQSQAQNSEFKADTQVIKLAAPINNKTTNVLRYPYEMSIADDTDYVSFQFFKYNPPFGKNANQSRLDFSSTGETNAYQFYNRSGVNGTEEKQIPSSLSSIVLYMPEDIQAQYGANWGGAEFGTGAVGMMRAFGTETPAPNVAASALKGMAKSKFYDEVLKQLNTMTNSNIGLDQFMGSVSGTILNPNTEMLYQGTTLRTFSLSFKMTPKNDSEAKKIKQICNTFKKAMLPSIGGQTLFGQSVSLLTVPDMCSVTFMQGSTRHPYLPVYKLCAIAGVDVNYTPDGAYTTYKGGSPVSTKLTVSFKEMKILFQTDIDTGNGVSH